MKLLHFIEKESNHSYKSIVLFTTISGGANAILLAIVNHAADNVTNDDVINQYFILYILAFLLFLYGQLFAYQRAIRAVEEALKTLRIRLTDKIRSVDLSFIEQNSEHGGIYARFTQENALMSQAVPQLTSAAQAGLLAFFSMLYLGVISPLSFVILFVSVLVSIWFFLSKSSIVRASLEKVVITEGKYLNSLSHLIEGFKEIKINQQKNDDLFEEIKQTSIDTESIKVSVGQEEMKIWGFGRNVIYLLLPIFIFILPRIEEEHAIDIYKISATMLFISGPITLMIASLPLINRINVFLDNIYTLEEELDKQTNNKKTNCKITFPLFKNIELLGVRFTYPTQNNDIAFSSGPFSLKISAGETLFIVGGNGSGKSTFLKVLTGLYYPQNGTIRFNNILINEENHQAYRESFSIIFTDFHLFKRFYGVQKIDEEKVNYWLKKMQMEHKTQYLNKHFTNINLSTGQRKRLAFIAAILEDKPILILDEFAADQDPGFRKYFYETLLQELKDMGKTVIAVTHDDHYFHVADRILKMDVGKITPIE